VLSAIDVWTRGSVMLTRRHIHAVKLTLPKMPDSTSPTAGAFRASGMVATKPRMAVRLSGLTKRIVERVPCIWVEV
jgi:hypothetical protein